MRKKKRHERKKDGVNAFLIHYYMAYWINVGSRGRAVITAGLKKGSGNLSF